MRIASPNQWHQVLRHIGRALVRLRGPVWPLALVPPQAVADDPELDRCPMCQGALLCPMDWGTLDDDNWWVVLRCGDCGVRMEIIIGNRQAAALDRTLDRQMGQIRRAADRLDAERMKAEADAFAHALQRDLIVAADF